MNKEMLEQKLKELEDEKRVRNLITKSVEECV